MKQKIFVVETELVGTLKTFSREKGRRERMISLVKVFMWIVLVSIFVRNCIVKEKRRNKKWQVVCFAECMLIGLCAILLALEESLSTFKWLFIFCGVGLILSAGAEVRSILRKK